MKAKPHGPIPEGFDADTEGRLLIGGRSVSAWVEEAGETPVFLYIADRLRQRVARLRSAMPERLRLNYAVKANPFPPLLETMRELVDGFDIASGGELAMCEAANITADRISFAGPGKRDAELAAAITAGVTLNCESEGEVERALSIGSEIGRKPRIALRVNPEFELRGSGMKMGGGAKPFGIDAARVPELARYLGAQPCDWRGLHVFTGSQALDQAAIIETQGNVLDLAAEICTTAGVGLPSLNMGGGFGVPYFHGDEALDIERVGEALRERFAHLPDVLAETEFHIELGRYLVAEAGIYCCRIVDRKESHGEIFLVTDGGLHHQLAASGNFGTVVRRNYPIAIADSFAAEPEERVNVVGCLCTPLDRLGDAVILPTAREGDIVVLFCAGAYGATASPAAFLGRGPAKELLV
ncbi:pyridoxal-dependent decarboxylase, exosortase A system-associated [Altererythrobacter aurantiacus]|uniref:Pyridoxal-dependent decarboxylase, exosortase A system-associated n=1 Tax=Parapontixanthobacter aurantiacus TaxID=1463599 RepID=A0A844ZA13_9SPHN|nr:pyridoxal-dependent decarboxylase, exosortase A system-associated [Parapontixanthobacter aurantiacus]MXO85421.1 pyridoxal-dependent decarboxylase, exosortase A system-associated [Parapontixanthobacter aurantiacus]